MSFFLPIFVQLAFFNQSFTDLAQFQDRPLAIFFQFSLQFSQQFATFQSVDIWSIHYVIFSKHEAVNLGIFWRIVIMVECLKHLSKKVPCQIHLKWWVDQIWDASSHKKFQSSLVSQRLPLSSQCVHKSAQWELFYQIQNSIWNLSRSKA